MRKMRFVLRRARPVEQSLDPGREVTSAELEQLLNAAPKHEGRSVLSGVDFSGASFVDAVNLSGVEIRGAALFAGARFERSVTFAGALLDGYCSFTNTVFREPVVFSGAQFRAPSFWNPKSPTDPQVSFEGAVFESDGEFGSKGSITSFWGLTSFAGATFTNWAGFERAWFYQPVSFRDTHFLGESWFAETHFPDYTSFIGARFAGSATFSRATLGLSPTAQEGRHREAKRIVKAGDEAMNEYAHRRIGLERLLFVHGDWAGLGSAETGLCGFHSSCVCRAGDAGECWAGGPRECCFRTAGAFAL